MPATATIDALVCVACHLPIHAECASILGIARCGCSGTRTIRREKIARYARRHTVARCVGAGALAITALLARQEADTVKPEKIDRLLARSRPRVDNSTAYAELVMRKLARDNNA